MKKIFVLLVLIATACSFEHTTVPYEAIYQEPDYQVITCVQGNGCYVEDDSYILYSRFVADWRRGVYRSRDHRNPTKRARPGSYHTKHRKLPAKYRSGNIEYIMDRRFIRYPAWSEPSDE
ncbi:MAG TPA: hypothetical protein VKP03_00795 [Patescibacteria group bacterium]|nr:hypothetical protein [Patescibacteria group bacterium]